MLGRIAVLTCVLACGCDVVFRVDRIGTTEEQADATSAGIAYVQSASVALAGNNTASLDLRAPVQAGNLVVVVIGTYGGSLLTVGDSAGNTYTKPRPGLGSDGGSTLHVLFAANVQSADRFTVTATVDGVQQREVTLSVHEYRGTAASPLDQHVLVSGAQGTPVSSGPLTSYGTGERLYFGAMLQDSTSSVSPGNGFTLRERPTDTTFGAVPTATQDMIGPAQSGVASEFGLLNEASWVCGLYSFQ